MAGERTINFYHKIIESQGGKSRMGLVSCPGFADFATIPDSPGRAIFEEDDRLHVVYGTHLYEVSNAGAPTAHGTLVSDMNPATLSTNGADELLVTSGTKGYIRDLSGTGVTLVVSDVTMGGSVDTFFLGLDSLTGTLKISGDSDGLTWDPTQIAQRSAAPDKWIAMLTVRREIFLFGAKTGEVWHNAGLAPFPFAQRPGAFFEVGIEAIWSLAPFGSTMAWLGRTKSGSGTVYWMNGYTPIPISNAGVEWAIQQYKDAGDISDAIGWSYDALGDSFYVLEFPSQGKTWVYAAKTSSWHERARWNSIDNDFVAYRARFHAEAFNKNLVCDNQSGQIYHLSSTVYTDVGGSALRRLRRAPHLSDENRRLYLDYFELEPERGVGNNSVLDPKVMLRISWDGGHTWGNERVRSLGKKGVYDQKVCWDRCGSGFDLMPEIVVSDPVQAAFSDAYIGIS